LFDDLILLATHEARAMALFDKPRSSPAALLEEMESLHAEGGSRNLQFRSTSGRWVSGDS
jgi:hypothetical protein